MSLISISASFGALVWIFQEGNLSEPARLQGRPGRWAHGCRSSCSRSCSASRWTTRSCSCRASVSATSPTATTPARWRRGSALTGGIITGAALIMVGVFGAFALSSIIFLKALGFAMALAVLIDATIVRGILVPAFMRVMGSLNWWAPRGVQHAVARLGLYEGPAETDGAATGGSATPEAAASAVGCAADAAPLHSDQPHQPRPPDGALARAPRPRREGDPFRPRANPGREALARRGFPYRDVTPADYVAEHGADMVRLHLRRRVIRGCRPGRLDLEVGRAAARARRGRRQAEARRAEGRRQPKAAAKPAAKAAAAKPRAKPEAQGRWLRRRPGPAAWC